MAPHLGSSFLILTIFVLLALLVCGSRASLPDVIDLYGPIIDPLASYDPQQSCINHTQPGTLKIAAFWKASNPNIGSGIGTLRACSVGDTSEHKEGRAMDYMLDYKNATQYATAIRVINWLLASDDFGNQYAMVRRMGLMYMIWNNKIWGAYRPSDAWRNYSVGGVDCSKLPDPTYKTTCHRDHIHMSFSWAGARGATSFFTVPIVTAPNAANYVGCYIDKSNPRDLLGASYSSKNMTVTRCRAWCGAKKFKFAGLQAGTWCFCDNSYGSYGTGTAVSCSTNCAGNTAQKCGGSLRNSVYKTTAFSNPVPAPLCVSSAQALMNCAGTNCNTLTTIPVNTRIYDLHKPLTGTWRAVGYRYFDGWVPTSAVVNCAAGVTRLDSTSAASDTAAPQQHHRASWVTPVIVTTVCVVVVVIAAAVVVVIAVMRHRKANTAPRSPYGAMPPVNESA